MPSEEDKIIFEFYNKRYEFMVKKDKELAKLDSSCYRNDETESVIDNLDNFKNSIKTDNAESYTFVIIHSLSEFRHIFIETWAYYQLIFFMPDKRKYHIAYETKIKIDACFLFLFSILDKIAQFIRLKCELELREEKTTFPNVWLQARDNKKNKKINMVFPIIKNLHYVPLWDKLRDNRNYRAHIYDPSIYFDCIKKRIPEISFVKEDIPSIFWYEIDKKNIEIIKDKIQNAENTRKLETLQGIRAHRGYFEERLKTVFNEEELKIILTYARKSYELVYKDDLPNLEERINFQECDLTDNDIRYVINDETMDELKNIISSEKLNILEKHYVTYFMYTKEEWTSYLHSKSFTPEETKEILNLLSPVKIKSYSMGYKGFKAILALDLLEMAYNSLLEPIKSLFELFSSEEWKNIST